MGFSCDTPFFRQVKKFADETVKPFATKIDKEEMMDAGVLGRIAQAGYLGANIAPKYAGLGLSQMEIGCLNEEIGRASASVRCILTVQGMIAEVLQRWGSWEQRRRLLPKLACGEVLGAFALAEEQSGSDAGSLQATAEESNGCYILDGMKTWVTFGELADVFLVFAQTPKGISAFLVEKNDPGLCLHPQRGLLGHRGTMTGVLELRRCRIPKGRIVGAEGGGLSLVAMTALDYGRYTVAWGCVGIAQACIEVCQKYVRERKQFGRLIREMQLVQKMETEMLVGTKLARLACANAGLLREQQEPDAIIETWVAKYTASKMVCQVTNNAVQILGANGCIADYPVERLYRDARISEIIEGTSQLHETVIATSYF